MIGQIIMFRSVCPPQTPGEAAFRRASRQMRWDLQISWHQHSCGALTAQWEAFLWLSLSVHLTQTAISGDDGAQTGHISTNCGRFRDFSTGARFPDGSQATCNPQLSHPLTLHRLNQIMWRFWALRFATLKRAETRHHQSLGLWNKKLKQNKHSKCSFGG